MVAPPPGFGWDPRKRERTLEKRGIDFYDAASVFDDIHTRYASDRVDDQGNELIWIISARRAEKHERESYQEDPWP